MIDFKFIGSRIPIEKQADFEPIILSRLFDGWKNVKDKYHRPGLDGDIVLLIEKQFDGDIKDVRIIIEYLYECAAKLLKKN